MKWRHGRSSAVSHGIKSPRRCVRFGRSYAQRGAALLARRQGFRRNVFLLVISGGVLFCCAITTDHIDFELGPCVI
jgi:hypothetical protein